VVTLAADFEAVLAAADLNGVHVVGAGLGGAVALAYARRYSRAQSLALLCTPPHGEAVDGEALRVLHPEARDEESLRASLSGAFSPGFREAAEDLLGDICEWRREEDANPEGVDAQRAALDAFDPGPLYEVGLPALICYGIDDPVVPASAARRLADDLPRGEGEAVEGRHLCFVEHSRAVTDRLLAHVEAVE
jgi:pimeloyl-ACP methyl ester carboxylesterase